MSLKWYRADVPKMGSALVKEAASAQLGIQYRLYKKKNGFNRTTKFSNGGKWFYRQGQFYFRSSEVAKSFENLVTFHFLSKRT